MNILGITHCISWNSAATLIRDGEIASINEEERFTRIKHSLDESGNHSTFPINAIKECLKVGGIGVHEIDIVAIGWGESTICGNPDQKPFVQPFTDRTLAGISDMGIPLNKVVFYNHHLSHAASSFFCSDFGFSNIISLDGAGCDCSGWLGFSEGAFANYYDINSHQAFATSFNEVIACDYSWGALWEDVTEMLGFKRHSGEGKTMGLAPYGEYDISVFPEYFASDGSPDLYKYYCFWSDKGWMREMGKQIDPMSATGKNVAYMLQHHYNNYLTKKAMEMVANGPKDFCLAGGVALNCTGNGHLSSLGFVNKVFVQPASGDSGTSLGAAILACRHHGVTFKNNFKHAYWGSEFSDEEIKKDINNYAAENGGLVYRWFPNMEERTQYVAKLLNEGKVVCNFQGKAEVGPRALGNRSILANPTKKETLDRVNKIKGREYWRPLAPSVLEEDYFEVVDSKVHSPYMLMACQVKEDYKDKIPAVVHVDGSCRPQTIYKSTNPIFHNIVLEFKKITGIPVILNTSFNLNYEPIVNSPKDAIKTFVECEAEVLHIGDYILEK